MPGSAILRRGAPTGKWAWRAVGGGEGESGLGLPQDLPSSPGVASLALLLDGRPWGTILPLSLPAHLERAGGVRGEKAKARDVARGRRATRMGTPSLGFPLSTVLIPRVLGRFVGTPGDGMPAPPLQITKWEVSCCPCSHLWWPVPGFCSEGCLEPALGTAQRGRQPWGQTFLTVLMREGVGLWEHGRVTAGPRAGIKGTQICGNSGIWGPQLRTCCPLASLFLSLLQATPHTPMDFSSLLGSLSAGGGRASPSSCPGVRTGGEGPSAMPKASPSPWWGLGQSRGP